MVSRSEEYNQQQVRLAAASQGLLMYRNNVGACEDKTGRMIRYGLCNDSTQLNKRIKSSDLIGVTPVLITPEYYGRILGVFTALECKRDDWSYSENDDRALAQNRFHEIVRNVGGFAGFVQSPVDMMRIIERGGR